MSSVLTGFNSPCGLYPSKSTIWIGESIGSLLLSCLSIPLYFNIVWVKDVDKGVNYLFQHGFDASQGWSPFVSYIMRAKAMFWRTSVMSVKPRERYHLPFHFLLI